MTTNFDRVTANPEALAKVIFGVIKNSETCECPAFTLCNGSGAKISCESTIVQWLNSEADKNF